MAIRFVNFDTGNPLALGTSAVSADNSGTTDVTSLLQAAISQTSNGTIFWPAGTYKISSTLVLPSNQYWIAQGRATIKWTGANNSDIIATAGLCSNSGISGFTIDQGTATGMTGLHVIDTQHCEFSNLSFQSTGSSSPSGTAIRLQAGATGSSSSAFNTAFNAFHNMTSALWSIGIQCDGSPTRPNVVTLNSFMQLDFEQVLEGIRMAQWCDSNTFYQVRLETEAANTFGVVFNDSATPAAETGVYDNNFYSLQMDAFGAASNVSVLFFNYTKMNCVFGLFSGPDPWPGSKVVDNLGRSQGHYVVLLDVDNTTNASLIVSKNFPESPGTTALTLANGLNSNILWNSPGGSRQRITGPTGGFSIGGFLNQSDALKLYIYNSTAQQMTIVNEDAGSTAANRIKTLTGANVVIAGPGFATFSYDGTDARWILENHNP